MFEWLTQLALRRARYVLAFCLVFFFACGSFGGSVAGRLPNGNAFVDPTSESSKAAERFEEVTGQMAAPGVLILVQIPEGVRTVDGMRRVRAITRRIKQDPGVQAVADVRNGDADARAAKRAHRANTSTDYVSKDGKQTYMAVFAKPNVQESDIGKRLEQAFAGDKDILIGGPGPAGDAIGDQVTADLGASEQIALPLLFFLMLFVFRGVVAALLPLFVGGLTIVGTLAILRIVNATVPLSIYALNLAVALGLGLAIDYSLFVVSRFREELDKGLEPRAAMTQTLHTAGRTVFFSSLTVAAALVSLGTFPQLFLYSMAISGCITALLASTISLIALPALLVVLGPRVNSLAPKRFKHKHLEPKTGFWYHLSQGVMKRATLVTIFAGGLLLLMGTPFLHVKFTGIDARVLPDNMVAKQIDTTLRTKFTSAGTEPISLVITQTPDDAKQTKLVDNYVSDVKRLGDIKNISEPIYIGSDTWALNINATTPTLDNATIALVRKIRAINAGTGPVLVAGQTATFIDERDAISHGLPISLGIIAFATLMILFLMTGSVLLPLKSLLMNVLAISSAFGILVFIFQDGRLQHFLQYHTQHGLESTQPLLLLALAFGLSTDYGVFLLTRIKENRDHGMANTEAVADGIQKTGRIITAAAMLFSVTIGAFATSKIIFIKEVGVGTVAAVVIDATLVRALLVPALMKLLAEWNWWAPKPLRKLHEALGIDESAPELPPEHVPMPAAPRHPGALAPTTPLSRLEVPSKRNDGPDPAPRPL